MDFVLPSCHFGASFKFLRFRVFLVVPGPGALRKRSGACLNASGVFVGSSLHVKMVETIGHFGTHTGTRHCPGILKKQI